MMDTPWNGSRPSWEREGGREKRTDQLRIKLLMTKIFLHMTSHPEYRQPAMENYIILHNQRSALGGPPGLVVAKAPS